MFRTSLARTSVFLYLCLPLAGTVPARNPVPKSPPSPPLRPPMLSLISETENQELRRGGVVTRAPEPTIGREMIGFGAVRVGITSDELQIAFRDMTRLKKSPLNKQVGVFSQTPKPEDLALLTLDEKDLHDLRNGRVGNCGFKLDADAIARARRLDWTRPDAALSATALVRQILLASVTRYLADGNPGLGCYNDKAYSLSLADEFESILVQPDPILAATPELTAWLRGFPKNQPPDSESFIYWSKDQVGKKPVISVTQVLMLRKKLNGHPAVLIASKQLYASHYFEGSLGLTLFIEDGAPGAGGILLYQNRTRSDVLRGSFVGMKRALISGELRESLRRNLLDLKRRLETEFHNTIRAGDIRVEGADLFE